jgi:hypothetical protein
MKMEPCPDRDKCSEVLHLIIDGEASLEEEEYFHNHILQCVDCSHYYLLEQSIRNAIRNKINRKIAPDDFIHQIRMKIKESQH